MLEGVFLTPIYGDAPAPPMPFDEVFFSERPVFFAKPGPRVEFAFLRVAGLFFSSTLSTYFDESYLLKETPGGFP